MSVDMFCGPYIHRGDLDERFDVPEGGFNDDLFSVRENDVPKFIVNLIHRE